MNIQGQMDYWCRAYHAISQLNRMGYQSSPYRGCAAEFPIPDLVVGCLRYHRGDRVKALRFLGHGMAQCRKAMGTTPANFHPAIKDYLKTLSDVRAEVLQ